jgi:hypothetical protein
MGFPRSVMRIFVPALETPGACRVRLAATLLKPCENPVEYRIRLSSPYILRSTPLFGTTREKARRMPKPSWQKLPMSCGRESVEELLDITCSVRFARNRRMVRRSVFRQAIRVFAGGDGDVFAYELVSLFIYALQKRSCEDGPWFEKRLNTEFTGFMANVGVFESAERRLLIVNPPVDREAVVPYLATARCGRSAPLFNRLSTSRFWPQRSCERQLPQRVNMRQFRKLVLEASGAALHRFLTRFVLTNLTARAPLQQSARLSFSVEKRCCWQVFFIPASWPSSTLCLSMFPNRR